MNTDTQDTIILGSIITTVLIGIVALFIGVSTSIRRDRQFEDACRIVGGVVGRVGNRTDLHDGCLSMPSNPTIIPVKAYR